MFDTLCYVNWDVDPVIFTLGFFSLRYYSLFFAIAFWLGYLITAKMFQDQKLPEEWVDKIFLYVIAATIIGARLGHVFFYAWDYYSQHPAEILMVWKGGLASHGGTLGIMAALFLYNRKVSHKSWLWVVDCISVPVALAAFFIRMGNLMNSEIFGMPTDVPWGFRFLRVDPDGLVRHPTQIYEALFYLAVFALLMFLYWKRRLIVRHGALFGTFMVCVFGFRILVEGLKENQEAFEDDMLLNMGQLLSIPFVLLGIACLVYAFRNKPDASVYASKK